MKTKLVAMAFGAALAATSVVPVLAGNAGDGSGYGTQPGYDIANGNTPCAGHGAFGILGKDASLGIEKVHATFLSSFPGPGTDGQQTGLNNSGLCGNRQGNLP